MKITNARQLKEAIILLEAHEKFQKEVVIEQFHDIYNGLKPANIIRNAFHKMTDSPGIANRIIGTTVGIGAGLLSKKILIGKSTNIFKRVFGTLLELVVANAVAKNADGIKQKGADLIKKLND